MEFSLEGISVALAVRARRYNDCTDGELQNHDIVPRLMVQIVVREL